MLTECCVDVDLGAVLPVLALLARLLQAPGVGVHGPGGAALRALHAAGGGVGAVPGAGGAGGGAGLRPGGAQLQLYLHTWAAALGEVRP